MLQLIDGHQAPIEIKNHPITSYEDPPSNIFVWIFFFMEPLPGKVLGLG
jgi:hypothetical protein